MQSPAAFHLNMLKSNIMLTRNHNIVHDIKGIHIFKLVYYIHIVEIPTNMRSNSCKLKISKIGNLLNLKKSKTILILRM